jgi:hypothetical protein
VGGGLDAVGAEGGGEGAAAAGLAAFSYAAQSWFADQSSGMGAHLDRAFAALQDLSGAGAGAPAEG